MALEVVLCNHHGREELIFKGHPVNAVLDVLVNLLRCLAQLVGATLYVVVGKRSIAVLEVEALLLLAALVFPVHVHCTGTWREESLHTFDRHLHVEQIVLAESVGQCDGLARSGRCREGDRRVCHIGRNEVKVSRGDVDLLGSHGVGEALVLALEECDMVSLGDVVLIVVDDRLGDSGTFSRQRDSNFAVFQHDVLGLSGQGSVEEGCGVRRYLLLGSLLAVEGCRLGILLSLLSLGLSDGVLHKLCTLLLFRRLRVPAVADKHKRDEHEADDVVLIHKSFLSGVEPESCLVQKEIKN